MTDKEPPPQESALEREPTEFDAIETWEQWLAEVQTWPGSKIKDYCILNTKRMVEKIKRDRPPVMPTGLVDEPGSFAMGGLLAEVRTLPESNMKKYCIWNAERMIEESKSASAREFSGSTGAPLSHCYPKRFCYRPMAAHWSLPANRVPHCPPT